METNRTFCYVTDAITAMLLVIIKGKICIQHGCNTPEINIKNYIK